MTQPAQPAPVPEAHDAHDARGRALGFLQAFLAYGLWGVLVLYFAVLAPASPLEVIGWRILLSVVVAGLALVATGRWGEFTALLRDGRALATFAVAGVLIAANWLSFVWAVSLGHGLEASLGYYINPLVAVLLGMLVLGERMRPLQWAAIGIACCAVAVLAVALGRIPWLGLAMATAFGLYGLVKKGVAGKVPVLAGIMLETTLILPLGLAILGWLAVSGGLVTGTVSGWHTFAMALAGVITTVPLVLYGAAARHLRLFELGIMQYLAPSIMFVVAVLVFREEMSPERWIGFALVWASLIVFTIDALRAGRRARRDRREGELRSSPPR